MEGGVCECEFGCPHCRAWRGELVCVSVSELIVCTCALLRVSHHHLRNSELIVCTCALLRVSHHHLRNSVSELIVCTCALLRVSHHHFACITSSFTQQL